MDAKAQLQPSLEASFRDAMASATPAVPTFILGLLVGDLKLEPVVTGRLV